MRSDAGTIVGVNVPYLYGDYGHDLAPSARHPDWPVRFEPMSAYRPLIEADRIGFRAVRIWLLENAEGLVIDANDRVTGVHPSLLEAVRVLCEAAHLHGLALYFGLLDGNAWPREGDRITRSILAEADQAARFAEKVVAPLTAALDPRVTLGVEIVNEPETCTVDCKDVEAARASEPVAWEALGRAIRLAKQAVVAEREVWVTSGTMHVFLPKLLASGAELTAVDIHVYHAEGGLPSRAQLRDYAGDHALLREGAPLIGGELGVPKPGGAPRTLCNYVHNARRLDYTAAFLWQLEGELMHEHDGRRCWTSLGEELHALLKRD